MPTLSPLTFNCLQVKFDDTECTTITILEEKPKEGFSHLNGGRKESFVIWGALCVSQRDMSPQGLLLTPTVLLQPFPPTYHAPGFYRGFPCPGKNT